MHAWHFRKIGVVERAIRQACVLSLSLKVEQVITVDAERRVNTCLEGFTDASNAYSMPLKPHVFNAIAELEGL